MHRYPQIISIDILTASDPWLAWQPESLENTGACRSEARSGGNDRGRWGFGLKLLQQWLVWTAVVAWIVPTRLDYLLGYWMDANDCVYTCIDLDGHEYVHQQKSGWQPRFREARVTSEWRVIAVIACDGWWISHDITGWVSINGASHIYWESCHLWIQQYAQRHSAANNQRVTFSLNEANGIINSLTIARSRRISAFAWLLLLISFIDYLEIGIVFPSISLSAMVLETVFGYWVIARYYRGNSKNTSLVHWQTIGNDTTTGPQPSAGRSIEPTRCHEWWPSNTGALLRAGPLPAAKCTGFGCLGISVIGARSSSRCDLLRRPRWRWSRRHEAGKIVTFLGGFKMFQA